LPQDLEQHYFSDVNNLIFNSLWLVEAAGVEPRVSIDYRQLADSTFAGNALNTMIANSAVQTLYKNFNEIQ